MTYKCKFYTLDDQLIEETNHFPPTFTGIIEYRDGTKQWCVDGACHRVDGPAVEYPDGSKHWWIKGKRHRLDGPAYVGADGTKEWYVDDKKITEKQCELLHSIMKLKGLL